LKEILRQAKEVIQIETEAVQGLIDRLDQNFVEAVKNLLACKGRVVVTGIGKSGLVGRKIAATLTSTGTPASFLHPVEGLHGDLGMVTPQDILIAISNSGETSEIIHLIPSVKKIGAQIIALTGSLQSTLAQNSHIVLDVGVEREACPLGLAPTSSTTATLVLGDALAVSLMRQRKFGEKDFALIHPGGTLGEKLHLRLKDILREPQHFPILFKKTTIADFLQALNRQHSDFALVLNPDHTFAGLVMDRDLRRGDIGSPLFLARHLETLMNSNLPAVDDRTSAHDAMQAMLDNDLVALPVLDPQRHVKGVVTLRDLLNKRDIRLL